jgi:hypothetical protein
MQKAVKLSIGAGLRGERFPLNSENGAMVSFPLFFPHPQKICQDILEAN